MGVLLAHRSDAFAIDIGAVSHHDILRLERVLTEMFACFSVGECEVADASGGDVVGGMQPPVVASSTRLGRRGGVYEEQIATGVRNETRTHSGRVTSKQLAEQPGKPGAAGGETFVPGRSRERGDLGEYTPGAEVLEGRGDTGISKPRNSSAGEAMAGGG